ncbi:hypothetical protein FB562_0167 [Homoserinimonas aerilata]|uniref:Uncharacterized protein n=1 Tax=Homoserinimonas aerilata TaxID=1162970 RepID=A0A542YG86_9MICO|nr:hypothetical protein FB562_0167 [Homoserinimonas aerilata]
MTGDIFAVFTSSLPLQSGAIVLAGVLPIAASFILDRIVALARGKGWVPMWIAVGLVLLVGLIGVLAYQAGVQQIAGTA